MPIPRAVGRWNKVGLNRVTRHVAPWLPGLGGWPGPRSLATREPAPLVPTWLLIMDWRSRVPS